jgi:hypothetical protein
VSERPNPGSREAVEAGCTCPVLDNCHGAGHLGGPDHIVVMSCPLHGAEEAA